MPNLSSLAGKTALVTGSARRLGRATVLALAEQGADVVVHYHRSREAAEETAESVRQSGVRAWTVCADLSDSQQSQALLARAVERAGPIDFLVNNASIFEPGRLRTFSADDLARNVQVNALAPLDLARSFAAQDRAGAIVHFLDAKVVTYDTANVAYHLSKRMLFSLMRMMALEFAPAVRVNAVAPGAILPPPGKDEAHLRALASMNPLNRVGDPEAITDAVLFLLRSEFITGQVIFVDGGYHLRGRTYG